MNTLSIGIGTHLFDTSGDLVLHNISVLGTATGRLERRANRLATLDQGSYVDDLGFSDGDRSVVVSIDDITDDQITVLRNIVRNHKTLWLTKDDGCFNAVLKTFDPDNGRVALTFLIYSRADE